MIENHETKKNQSQLVCVCVCVSVFMLDSLLLSRAEDVVRNLLMFSSRHSMPRESF